MLSIRQYAGSSDDDEEQSLSDADDEKSNIDAAGSLQSLDTEKHVPLLLPAPLVKKDVLTNKRKEPRQSAAAVKRPPRSRPRSRLCVSRKQSEDNDVRAGETNASDRTLQYRNLSNDDFKLLTKSTDESQQLSTSSAMIGYDCYRSHYTPRQDIDPINSLKTTPHRHFCSETRHDEYSRAPTSGWNDGFKHPLKPTEINFSRGEVKQGQEAIVVQPYKSKRARMDRGQGSNSGPLTDDGTQKHDLQDLFKTHHPAITIAIYNHGQHKISSIPTRKLNSILISANSPVNKLKWCPFLQYSHLLATASMDGVVRVVNALDRGTVLRQYHNHTAAVKDLSWTVDGTALLSCGFDTTARLINVETGQDTSSFKHSSFLTCCRFHPANDNLFIAGASNSQILGGDLRTGKLCRTYTSKGQFGQVLDVEFLWDGSTFISSSDIVARDCSSKTLMAWDFSTTAVLSNQIYQENYTCPQLKCHPDGNHFLSQSNGNYIAVFSTQRPYRLNKYKRYESHSVMSYSVGLDTSPDGQFVVSGSSDGQMYIYQYGTSKLIKRLDTNRQICLSVQWHPLLSDTVATSSWDGYVDVWAGTHSTCDM